MQNKQDRKLLLTTHQAKKCKLDLHIILYPLKDREKGLQIFWEFEEESVDITSRLCALMVVNEQ